MFSINPDEIDVFGEFQVIAEIVLNNCFLQVSPCGFLPTKENSTNLQICEIEFYYKTPTGARSIHPDPFVHSDKDQLTHTCFYFHRQNGGKYKGGTFKGLDITCGDEKQIFGGILIRSIICGNEMIEGPCKVVDKILELTKAGTIEQLTKQYNNLPPPVNQPDKPLRMVMTNQRNATIFSGPRVGLSLAKVAESEDPKIKYIMKPYRFLTCPGKIVKYKHLLVLRALYHDDPTKRMNIDDIIRVMNVKKATIQKWIEHWEAGREMTINNILSYGMDTVERQCQSYRLMN